VVGDGGGRAPRPGLDTQDTADQSESVAMLPRQRDADRQAARGAAQLPAPPPRPRPRRRGGHAVDRVLPAAVGPAGAAGRAGGMPARLPRLPAAVSMNTGNLR
jgi:hypothetical protein